MAECADTFGITINGYCETPQPKITVATVPDAEIVAIQYLDLFNAINEAKPNTIDAKITAGCDLSLVPLSAKASRQVGLVWRPSSPRADDYERLAEAFGRL